MRFSARDQPKLKAPTRPAHDTACLDFSAPVRGLRSLHAFGSRAREVADWAEGKRPAIAIELEEIFQAGRVDLAALPEADPFLAANVIRGERLSLIEGK